MSYPQYSDYVYVILVVWKIYTMWRWCDYCYTASVKIQPGACLIGVIDEKLDNGYVVTVKLGYDTLKGILYHIPDKPPPSWSPNHTPRRRKRKKSQLSLVEYTKLKPVTEGQGTSFSNNGQMLNQLSEPEKQVIRMITLCL